MQRKNCAYLSCYYGNHCFANKNILGKNTTFIAFEQDDFSIEYYKSVCGRLHFDCLEKLALQKFNKIGW